MTALPGCLCRRWRRPGPLPAAVVAAAGRDAVGQARYLAVILIVVFARRCQYASPPGSPPRRKKQVIQARVDSLDEATRSEKLNDAVVKILDALRTNGYEPYLRIEDITYEGGGDVPRVDSSRGEGLTCQAAQANTPAPRADSGTGHLADGHALSRLNEIACPGDSSLTDTPKRAAVAIMLNLARPARRHRATEGDRRTVYVPPGRSTGRPGIRERGPPVCPGGGMRTAGGVWRCVALESPRSGALP